MEWTGSATGTRTMNEVYSASKTLEALSAQMSERIWMTAQTPVDYTMVNGYFVDDTTVEHFTRGTLQSSGWGGGVILKRGYDSTGGGAVDFIASDIGLTVTGGTTGDTGVLMDFNTVLGTEVVWIRADVAGGANDAFDNDSETLIASGGTGTNQTATPAVADGESVWANPNTIATLADFTEVYIYQSRSLTDALANADDKAAVVATKGTAAWWPTGNIDILLKVQENDVLFDQGFATFFAHQYNNLFSFSVVDLSAGARTPIALETQADGNNATGHRLMTSTASGGTGTFVVGEEVTTGTKSIVLTSVAGTSADPVLGYRVAGEAQVDIVASDALTGATSGATVTTETPTNLGPTLSPASTMTITHTNILRDLVNGAGSQPYSIEPDQQGTAKGAVYEKLKFQCSRGTTATGLTDGIEGEQYLGNELHLDISTPKGTLGTLGNSEGTIMFMWLADGTTFRGSGILVANHGDNPGGLQLRNVRLTGSGTIARVGDTFASYAASTDGAVVDVARTITPIKAAPFGTFAGGTFFGAPGVWPIDFNAGDETSIQLTDDLGETQLPPDTVSVLVTSLISGDSVAVFRRVSATAGSAIDRAEYNPSGSQGPATSTSAGLATLTTGVSISNEAPPAGKVQVVDVSNNNETIRYRYASFTGAIFTLTGSTGTADAGSSTSVLFDAAADFVTDGVEVGDIVRNTTDGEEGIVTVVTDLNTLGITTTASTWEAKLYEVNMLARPYVAGDDVWVPFILRIADATTESNTIIHAGGGDIPVRVVVRSAGVVEPQEFDQVIANGGVGMTQAMIRNADNIFV